jgi:hypothetical protein
MGKTWTEPDLQTLWIFGYRYGQHNPRTGAGLTGLESIGDKISGSHKEEAAQGAHATLSITASSPKTVQLHPQSWEMAELEKLQQTMQDMENGSKQVVEELQVAQD